MGLRVSGSPAPVLHHMAPFRHSVNYAGASLLLSCFLPRILRCAATAAGNLRRSGVGVGTSSSPPEPTAVDSDTRRIGRVATC